jgi:hypothetical protein
MSDTFDHEGDAYWQADLDFMHGVFDHEYCGYGWRPFNLLEWLKVKEAVGENLDKQAAEFQRQWIAKRVRSKTPSIPTLSRAKSSCASSIMLPTVGGRTEYTSPSGDAISTLSSNGKERSPVSSRSSEYGLYVCGIAMSTL